ncbi:TATA box-binding protein-associated factor RNA polymerase I subunit A-like [Glandiceps talaboti]
MLMMDGRSAYDADSDDDVASEILSSFSDKTNSFLCAETVLGKLRTPKKNITKSKQLLHLLRECLLNHRWIEAGQVLRAICLEPNNMEDVVWKCGIQIMYNHPKTGPGIVRVFNVYLQKLMIHDHSQKTVEHAFYLLSKGELEEAYSTLNQAKILSNRNIHSSKKEMEEIWHTMVFLYRGLINYVMWLESKTTINTDVQTDLDMQSGYDKSNEMVRYGNDAAECFEVVMNTPGVWDIFITKYVEILEYQERYDEAQAVLHKYRDSNSNNPNAHKYLYSFLKKHDAHPNESVLVLKDLLYLVPSDELAMDMSEIVQKSADNPALALPFLFDMLDYACWQDDIKPWEMLADLLILISKRNNREGLKIKRECWTSRSSWWPSYHFRECHIRTDTEQERKLLDSKAAIATLLSSSHLTKSRENLFMKSAKKVLKGTNSYKRLKKAIMLKKDK